MRKKGLIRNKAYALILVAVGLVPTILFKDLTLLIFASFLAIPLLLAKENWID